MIHTIYVYSKFGEDPKGESLLKEVNGHGAKQAIKSISTANVFRLEGVSKKQATILAEKVFCEDITQNYSLNKPPVNKLASGIEIGYKQGVMNPQVSSIDKSARDLRITPRAISTSTLYILTTSLPQEKIKKIIEQINLFNPLTEEIITKPPKTLTVKSELLATKNIPIRSMTDAELMELSKDTLFLDLKEMTVIKKYFQKLERDPTDCELEVIAQTWSEHCIHKTFKSKLIVDGKKKSPLFTRIKSTAKHKKNIVSAFSDNAGVIDFYDGFAVCGKVETHNSPSAIEPYGGAMTGSGGVFRDILGTGKGAKPIVSTDIFCLAPFTLPTSKIPPGCLPPKYILTKVIEGVRDYGNRVGIPTNNGSLHFHEGFRAKPTVAVGAYGLLPKKMALKNPVEKDFLILTLGGRTGRDGIHGATFSSSEMSHATKTVSQTAVQIGNAIEEKRLIDAVLMLRDKNLIQSITDCGAGGYSSAVGEMAEKTGANVYLDQVPLKYSGLSPWEIFLSESQERMVIAVKEKDLASVLSTCKLYNVEASVIGEFTDNERLKVFYKTELVCDLSMDFIHHGLPQKILVGKSPKAITRTKVKLKSKKINLQKVWPKILSHPSISSKEPILRLYDHNVQGSNALHPYTGVDFDGPNDASVVRPLLNKPYGFITAHGLNPSVMEHDTYWGSVWAITEALANYVSVGGDIKDAALIDNFIWPAPDENEIYRLDRAVDACLKMSDVLALPFVSGKDSLSSTYRYPDGKILKIPPVLLVSVFGKIPDVKKTISSDLKNPGSKLYLVGSLDFNNMAGSIFAEVTKTQEKDIPRVDLKKIKTTLKTITHAIKNGYILSCHDISEGGIVTALSEMCFGGDMGAVINIGKFKKFKSENVLFNETPGAFVVELNKNTNPKKVFANTSFVELGETFPEKLIRIKSNNQILAEGKLSSLKSMWKEPLKEVFA